MGRHTRRSAWAGLLTCAVVVLGLAAGVAATTGPAGALGDTHPQTIVRVEGDAANGFGIHRYDGSAAYPPTDSEARAECGEHDRLRQRVRCRTQVRVWYRDLAELQRSLEWALEQRRPG